MKALLDDLKKFKAASEPLQQRLYDTVTDKRYLKKDFLLKAGEVNRHIWFIEKGLVIIYRESDEGTQVMWILDAGHYVIATDSFSTGCPSKYNILVLEDTTAWLTTRKDLIATCEMYPEFWAHYTGIEGYYRKIGETFTSMTPRERFDDAWNNRRDLFNRVKKEWLASYLGMSLKTFDEYKKGKRP